LGISSPKVFVDLGVKIVVQLPGGDVLELDTELDAYAVYVLGSTNDGKEIRPS
jgi:hypothetical protein